MHKITLKSVDLLVLEWFFMVLAWPLELHVRVRSHSQHPPLNGSSRTARTNIYARNLKIVGPCWHVAPLCWPTLPPLNAPWSMFSPSNLFLLYAKIAKSLARQKTSKLTLCFFSRANRLCHFAINRSCKFLYKVFPVKFWGAFRLRRLAQSVVLGFGP